MKLKLLLDTNILLDLVLERPPFCTQASRIFRHIEQGNIDGFITATTITDIFYIIRKAQGRDLALAAIKHLLQHLKICAVDQKTIQAAIDLELKDFEDSIQLACANLSQLDGIVTRNGKDFVTSSLPIYSPTELLNTL